MNVKTHIHVHASNSVEVRSDETSNWVNLGLAAAIWVDYAETATRIAAAFTELAAALEVQDTLEPVEAPQ